MADIKTQCRMFVAAALNQFKNEKFPEASDIIADSIPVETPPDPKMGDAGVPLFMFAKTFRMAPPVIAQEISKIVNTMEGASSVGVFSAVGPYVNVKLDKGGASAGIIQKITEQGVNYGSFGNDGKKPLADKRVMVEFSSPNTNKPLHLGHLRNDALGESVSRILKAAGAEVFKVNIINNRGVHICKSMLAYVKYHSGHPEYITENGLSPDYVFTLGDTPESIGKKSDHFVGDCYVEFNNMTKENPEVEKFAQNMLVEWEKGNVELRKLWQQMNDWAIGGVSATYKRTGVSFDKLYYESETYLKGREEILKGLEQGLFYREEDGSVWVDLAEINLDKKVLLRKDGTALYMTQDIGTAINRHNDWAFNRLVYVVASEQNYHFKVLFYVLKKLGFEWADELFHLSYGMVNLPDGRMKSREGTVVDADDLIDSLRNGALEEITSKGREEAVGNPTSVAESVALAALHYYLLQVSPVKDMVFNPKESLSFTGNTGPYLQYMGARISSILRKAAEAGTLPAGMTADGKGKPENLTTLAAVLTDEAEWELVKLLGEYPAIIKRAADTLDPSCVAGYLYDVSKSFSKFYHDCPILAASSKDLITARLVLASCVKTVLENAMDLILVPFLETM